MSTLHHVCTACFFDERRGFTFIGSLPAGAGLDCPRCGARTHRIVRLGAAELGPRAELAWDRDDIVVREPRWERLRQTLIGVLTALWRFDVVRRDDGLLEIPVRDRLSLVVRPVHDHITGQEGCLLASALLSLPDGADAAAVRAVLAQLNDAIGERVLLLGTMRDLFTLADARPTIFYRHFLPRASLLDAELFAANIDRARRLSLLLHQALATFGPTREALTFVARLDPGTPLEPPAAGASWDAAASGLIAAQGTVDLEEMLARADALRGPRAARDEVRDLVLGDYLCGLGLDLDAARDPTLADRFHLHHGELAFTLAFERDERDSYLRLTCELARLDALDDEVAALVARLMDALDPGELHLHRDADALVLELRETLLGDDLDVTDLARVLADTATRATRLRTALGPRAAAPAATPPRGASLGPLLDLVARHRAAAAAPPLAREEALGRRVQDFLRRLQLRPALSPGGDLQIAFDERLVVRLRLVVERHAVAVRVQARLVERIGVPLREALDAIVDLACEPRLGGFRIRSAPGRGEQQLVFEDLVPADSLDLNELVRTLYAVAHVAARCGPPLRQRLEAAPSEDDEAQPPLWRRTVQGLVERYRRGSDEATRARLVRALAMFEDPAASATLLDALADPSVAVGAAAVAALVAGLDAQPLAALERITAQATDTRLGDELRGRALRVLGAARGRGGAAIGALRQLATDVHESVALRARALEALAALDGGKPVVDALIAGVQDGAHRVAHTALQALGRLEVLDPARRFLAAQAAVDTLALRDVEERGEVFATLASLGLPQTVLDLVGDAVAELAPEIMAAVAEAAAAHRPPREDLLGALLAHPRGEARAAATAAIARHRVAELAPALVEALEHEPDRSLVAAAIVALGGLGVRSERIEEQLRRLAVEPALREASLAALGALTRA